MYKFSSAGFNKYQDNIDCSAKFTVSFYFGIIIIMSVQ